MNKKSKIGSAVNTGLSKKMKVFLIILFIAIIAIVIGITSYAAYTLDSSYITYTTTSGSETSVRSAIDDLNNKANKCKPVYKAGELYWFKKDYFQVLNDVYKDQRTFEIISQYPLNQDATRQTGQGYYSYFSYNNYWSSTWVSGKRSNLNLIKGCYSTDLMGKIRSYAKSMDAVAGRLLTYEEAISMRNSSNSDVVDMLKGTKSMYGSLKYWLGSSSETNKDYVYYQDGLETKSAKYKDTSSDTALMRPILVVFKNW